jgi:ribosomal protein S18 acetylase RimI-like enzyme
VIAGAGSLDDAPAVRCARMTAATRHHARDLLAAFLAGDDHYLASASAYGDAGPDALDRALDLFVAHPETGFVWLAFAGTEPAERAAAGACVVCYAISTSRGSRVAKLDDVTIAPRWRGRGVGNAMLAALSHELLAEGVTRIDCGCHRDNAGAWRFYQRLGFVALGEERLAWVLDRRGKPAGR